MGHPNTTMKHPLSTSTSTHHQAEKSPFRQRVLSILIVGPSQLKYRRSRTRKPKSHPSSNTQCPITPTCSVHNPITPIMSRVLVLRVSTSSEDKKELRDPPNG